MNHLGDIIARSDLSGFVDALGALDCLVLIFLVVRTPVTVLAIGRAGILQRTSLGEGQ